MKMLLIRILCIGLSTPGFGQDTKPLSENVETRYYDFWPGTWYRVVNGKMDTTSTCFKVARSVHPAAFEEKWRMVIDSTTTVRATALRAWDKTSARWMYTWVSDNGLHQVWEGRKVDGNWYIYRPFDINGDKYLSRQAWIPEGPKQLMRISEKSYDDGKTWQLRFKEYFARNDHDGENSAMTTPEFNLVHITLATTNMPAMKKFYDAVFGASLQAQEMFGTTLYQGTLGGISLLLCPNEIARAKAEQNRHQLRFTVKDIAATMRLALASGATLLNEISDHDGAKIASVRDPDGNSIEFLQAAK
jgi:catechol 2,3-dioxygenase-like lactoylglutathione lyase family enzyme